ncbi:unnamed protein product [Protopolystoma xenopodis]|uniref:Uncharacterized protein n=1 Tax=Protopolystoma xenopodis TaxID=117903 RepID=A0A3S5C448_9PLAT|nr:unnamed protein product [Protopolystoma xenopodis]
MDIEMVAEFSKNESHGAYDAIELYPVLLSPSDCRSADPEQDSSPVRPRKVTSRYRSSKDRSDFGSNPDLLEFPLLL